MNQIGVIQILRAAAALMIVFSHAQNDALTESLKAGVAFSRFAALPWDAGVDLFFVISGFIMVHASERLFATRGAGGAFISRRLVRIVPLYWCVTAIGLAIIGYVAWLGKRSFPALPEIVSSLGFVPFARPGDGALRPIVPQGWTLNYEMFFYALFALFVGFRREAAVAGVTLSLAGMIGMGALLRPSAAPLIYWSDPLVLEFALGMGLALAWRRGVRIGRVGVALALVVASSVLSCDFGGMGLVDGVGSDASGFIRLFSCGVPMALLFGGLVLATPALATKGRLSGLLALLGDASYALYLFHPLVIIATRKVFIASGAWAHFGAWPAVLADLPLAAAGAVAIHLGLEKPVTAFLNLRLPTKAEKAPRVAVGVPGS